MYIYETPDGGCFVGMIYMLSILTPLDNVSIKNSRSRTLYKYATRWPKENWSFPEMALRSRGKGYIGLPSLEN